MSAVCSAGRFALLTFVVALAAVPAGVSSAVAQRTAATVQHRQARQHHPRRHHRRRHHRRHAHRHASSAAQASRLRKAKPAPVRPRAVAEAHPQAGWVAPGTTPLSDAQAAGLVTHEPETRPANANANRYVPTDAQLQAFHSATRSDGTLADSANTLRKYVTGRPGLSNPSTDDLIQWTAHKWGIPEDWIRAQMVIESSWNQTALGDRSVIVTNWASLYPGQAHISGSADVYQSMGLPQIRWAPDGSQSPGTEPLRWQSTAFALDYLGAQLRWYYDGDCSWCGTGYSSGQQWNSIGAWYEPYPWNNGQQQAYIRKVQAALATRRWTTS
ncbi:MAG: hypothetical protein ACJ76X_03655 [Solirubrobacteraceae bacterium]|jgi:hypothetical protein